MRYFIEHRLVLPAALFFMCLFGMPMLAQATDAGQLAQEVVQNAKVDTASATLAVKVAPGELLPISVKLSNFGGGRKVDVTLTYGIFDSAGKEIFATSETVAVETTASFVKSIQIPFGTPPGKYVARTSIAYQDQVVPATTQFPFLVENKIIGLFQSDFYLYGIIILIIGIITWLVGHFWIKARRASRLTPHEYLQVPEKDRIFFEIISDTIMHIRYRVGNQAIEIAKSIEDLVIDQSTGRVLEIKSDPAKIIALLILKYEKLLGQKVSFAIRRPDDEKTRHHLAEVDKNLIIIKKYFE